MDVRKNKRLIITNRSHEKALHATAIDVARLAGVSQSAVSRAFSANASISNKTRTKVLDAARTLGYQPNFAASSLVTGVSRIIGIAVASMSHSFYVEIIQYLSTALASFGFRPMLFSLISEDESDPILDEVLRYRVDAIILVSAHVSSRFAEDCAQVGLPIILVNRAIRNTSTALVKGDDYGGAFQIAQFLVSGGHTRFAFVSGPDQASTNRERLAGFRDALASNGIKEVKIINGEYIYESGLQAANQLLNLKCRPDAVFCANDDMAMGVIDGIKSRGADSVGTEMSVIGFDDIPLSRRYPYQLTTYRQPIKEMAQNAVHLAIQAVNGKDTGKTRIVLSGQLIVRRSAKLPKLGLREIAHGEMTWLPNQDGGGAEGVPD